MSIHKYMLDMCKESIPMGQALQLLISSGKDVIMRWNEFNAGTYSDVDVCEKSFSTMSPGIKVLRAPPVWPFDLARRSLSTAARNSPVLSRKESVWTRPILDCMVMSFVPITLSVPSPDGRNADFPPESWVENEYADAVGNATDFRDLRPDESPAYDCVCI